MIDLKQIFICRQCGEVDGVASEVIDVERDDLEYHVVCSRCGGSVQPKKTDDGVLCYRTMSQDEIWAEMGFFDEEEW